jgi:hypothetical protein
MAILFKDQYTFHRRDRRKSTGNGYASANVYYQSVYSLHNPVQHFNRLADPLRVAMCKLNPRMDFIARSSNELRNSTQLSSQ